MAVKTFQIEASVEGSPLGASGHLPRGVQKYVDAMAATFRRYLSNLSADTTEELDDIKEDVTALASGKVDKVTGQSLVDPTLIASLQQQLGDVFTQLTILKDMGKTVVISGANIAGANGSYVFATGYEGSRIWELLADEELAYSIVYDGEGFVIQGHSVDENDEYVITPLYRAVAAATDSPWTAELVWVDSWGEGIGADDDSIISVA